MNTPKRSPDYARGIIARLVSTMPALKDGLTEVRDVLDDLEHGRSEYAAKLLHDCEIETDRADKAERALAQALSRLSDIQRDGYIPESILNRHLAETSA